MNDGSSEDQDAKSELTAKRATDRMVAALRKAHAMPPKEQKDMKRGKLLTEHPNAAKQNPGGW